VARAAPARAAPALVAVVLASLVGTSCGKGGPQPSRAQFSARAAAICANEDRKLDYIRNRARARRLSPQAPSVLRKEAAAGRAATEDLEALERPRGAGSEIRRWLTARAVAATITIDLAEAPSAEHTSAVAAVAAELGRARERVRALSGTFGGGACDAAL
jgi:hypothetical protein